MAGAACDGSIMVITKTDSGPSRGDMSVTQERYRYEFSFRVTGDLRFLSHQDTLRLFQRALARGNFPVQYSQGFNPHPRMMIPLPRPVGVASDAESVIVEVTESIDERDALNRLERQTPPGLHLLKSRRLAPGEKTQPTRVRYRLKLYDEDLSAVQPRLAEVLGAKELLVERKDFKKGGGRVLDVRPYLAELSLVESALEFVLLVTPTGTAKPAEIAGLFGFDPDSIHHRIRRVEIQWGP